MLCLLEVRFGLLCFFIVFMGAPAPQGCSQMSAGVEGKGSAHCGVVLVAISGQCVFNHTDR